MTTTYFLGSNTPFGFLGRYEHLLLGRATILLGGAGTGKSSLMRKIHKIADENGYDTEIYLCSSDVDSLDAVYIPSLNYAVLDGTSPHSQDAKFPITRHTVVNLLDNADKKKILEHKEEIELCTKTKKAYFNKAYCNLHCAYLQYMAKDYVYSEKLMMSTADRVFKMLKTDEKSTKTRFISSISNKGLLDNLIELDGKKIGLIGQDVEISRFLEILIRKLDANNMGYTSFTSPTLLTPDALKVGDYIIANNLRFINPDYSFILDSGLYDFSMEEKLISMAIEDINLAHITHMSMEKYYSDAMDWSDVNRKTEKIIEEIFT